VHGQLHASIAGDPRVVELSGTDARHLDRALVPAPVGCIVADVSFIALAKALPAALALAAPGCWLVALVKPQFELGPAAIGKGGIVKDPADGPRALAANVRWLSNLSGWRVVDTCQSPLTGKGGNQEYLIGAVHDG
jgi:23S rRNA (cytidine1920-2'-O)/16S rRNA (cytidine1409-2'-O)-methyltransferase